MTFAELVGDAKKAVSIISNPNQASVAAAAAAGGFSAEVNNLRKQALIDLQKYGQTNQILQTLGVTKFFNSVLNGDPANPIPASGSGSSLLWIGVGGVALLFILIWAVKK